MRISLPVIGADKISLCYTGFDDDEKLSLEKLFRSLQLEASPFMNRVKTTHLLIPDVYYSGRKLGAAQDWGIPIILPSWINELAASNPPVEAVVDEAGVNVDAYPTATSVEKTAHSAMLDGEAHAGLPPIPSQNGPLAECIVHVHSKLDVSSVTPF